MKKAIYLLITCLSLAFAANAQLGEKFTFGLRAGMGIGGFSSSDPYRLIGGNKSSNWDMETKQQVTYNVGAIFDIPVYRKWGLSAQTGLWFTERHTKFNGTNSHNSTTWRNLDLKAMYLQLPIQIGYHYNFKGVNVQALFGPFLEYRLGDGNSKAVKKKDENKTDAFSSDDNAFSWGLSFGLGAEYRHIYLGIKYDLGLTNYYDGSNKDRKDDQQLDLKGNMFSIVLGWNF
ncbi:MAG: PorT family protein [Muribaculaceae bacterium]|nr:PorT family protein [Muribaculaceae bacterium]